MSAGSLEYVHGTPLHPNTFQLRPGSDVEDEDAGFKVRQLPVRKHEVEETDPE